MYDPRLLVSLLTEYDRKEEERARKAKRYHNPYAIAHYFRAANEIEERVKNGENPTLVFSQVFCPARFTHSISKKLGLGLDVNRGLWVIPEGKDS